MIRGQYIGSDQGEAGIQRSPDSPDKQTTKVIGVSFEIQGGSLILAKRNASLPSKTVKIIISLSRQATLNILTSLSRQATLEYYYKPFQAGNTQATLCLIWLLPKFGWVWTNVSVNGTRYA